MNHATLVLVFALGFAGGVEAQEQIDSSQGAGRPQPEGATEKPSKKEPSLDAPTDSTKPTSLATTTSTSKPLPESDLRPLLIIPVPGVGLDKESATVLLAEAVNYFQERMQMRPVRALTSLPAITAARNCENTECMKSLIEKHEAAGLIKLRLELPLEDVASSRNDIRLVLRAFKPEFSSFSETIVIPRDQIDRARFRLLELKDRLDTGLPVSVRPSRLTVVSDVSSASLFLDGQLFGEVPIVAREIKAGTYKLRLEAAGYLPMSKVVQISRSEQKQVRFALIPALSSQSATHSERPERVSSTAVYETWWFWTIVAVSAAAATGIAIGVAASQGGIDGGVRLPRWEQQP